MPENYRWALSPSKFEASRGCPCFEENPRNSAVDKDRGTDLHEYMEDVLRPLTELDQQDAEAVQFCRDVDAKVHDNYGPFVEAYRELGIRKTDRSPGGKLDFCGINKDGTVVILDWKFGVQPVPAAESNMQILAYALMAHEHFVSQGKEVNHIVAGIVQPAQMTEDLADIGVDELDRIERELKEANDRVNDPFKEPDPSDATKCQRCKHASRCPAIAGAVTKFIDKANLLPMPEQFAPDAIVSERDRIIAQELATIFETWAERVKQSNREYAIQNGGTLGGIYNVTTRANGYEIGDIPAFASGLVDRNLMASSEDILPFVRVSKGKLIEGLTTLNEGSEDEVKTIISELEEKFGVPKPPVTVFRKGGKKQIASAISLLDVPMIDNPFK
jgi:CRISPR/Cas system-associated exonuclease Cas4 (RecB family)